MAKETCHVSAFNHGGEKRVIKWILNNCLRKDILEAYSH